MEEEINSFNSPVRKIGKNHTALTGKVPNVNTTGLNSFESSLERDFIRLTNFNPNVERFVEQPVTIEYYDHEERKKRKYTPDFLIFYKNDGNIEKLRPTLIEVKYREAIKKDWPSLKKKFLAALRYCDSKNWRFKIITEKEVRTDYLFNANFLQTFSNSSRVRMEDVELLINILKDLDETTPLDLLNSLSVDERTRGQYLYTLWHLIAVHLVNVDLTRKLTMSSTIWSKV